MPFVPLENQEERELLPGFRARFVHSAHLTVAYWKIKAGAVLPDHAHPQEQISNVIEGAFELTIEGETRTLGRGTVAVIPAHTQHSGRAITQCQIIDVFYPVREDYR